MMFSRFCGVAGSIKISLFLLALFCAIRLCAQTAEPPLPKDVKILDERSDGKGNLIRVIQYRQGLMKVTQTIIVPKTVTVGFTVPINPDTMNKDSVTVIVDKSDYCLQVFYKKRIIRSYRAVFGPKPLENKCMEGDRCTPEGWFKITNKNSNSHYNKFMGLNYPNDSAVARFKKLKSDGTIPQTAKIGSSVGIHGIWPGGDNMIDLGVGWTDGCVALKNKDIEELYSFVGVGTRVFIKK